MTEILAIIPARGGSKGIPGKNIIPLAGKPLIAYTIQNARQSRFITRLVVSTDSADISAVARTYGAEMIKRPAEISGDTASSESALLHTLHTLQAAEGYTPDLIVFLQCTAPLTLPEDIDAVVERLIDENADSAFSVTPFSHFIWRIDETGNAVGVNHDKRVRLRRQERAPEYQETGAVYVMRTAGFLEHQHRFFGKTVLSVIPAARVLDIDEPADLVIAEMRLRERGAV